MWQMFAKFHIWEASGTWERKQLPWNGGSRSKKQKTLKEWGAGEDMETELKTISLQGGNKREAGPKEKLLGSC